MSINLFCNAIDLWQTPTHITYMVLTNDECNLQCEVSGNLAKAALTRYILWVNSAANGIYDDAETARETQTMVREHIAEVRYAMENPGLTVWSA